MSYHCEVKEQFAQPVLSLRIMISAQDLSAALDRAYWAIAQYLDQLGEDATGPPFAAYFNRDVQHLDVEMGFPVSRRLPDNGDIGTNEVPAGKFATCLHTGPRSEIGSAYDALLGWTKENGYEIVEVAYEIYIDNPAYTPPNELRTQILFQLKAA
jgi:effector-binding domain-containing protein